MTVQKTLERLKRGKTAHSTEDLDRLGWARYEDEDAHIRVSLPSTLTEEEREDLANT